MLPGGSLPFFVAETSLVSVSVATRANGTRAVGQEKGKEFSANDQEMVVFGILSLHNPLSLCALLQLPGPPSGPYKNAVLKQFPQDSLCWGCGSGCSLAGKPHVCVQFKSCPKFNTSGQGNGLPLLHGNTETKLLSSNIDFL